MSEQQQNTAASEDAPAGQVDSQTQAIPASAVQSPTKPAMPVTPVPARPTVKRLTPSNPGVQAASAVESVRMAKEMPPVTGVDPQQIQSVSDQLKAQFVDAVADLTGTTKEVLASAAAYFLPLIAEQSILQAQATTPDAQALAARNKRHLEGRMLMQAANYGINLQQRNETRLLGIVDGLISRGAALV